MRIYNLSILKHSKTHGDFSFANTENYSTPPKKHKLCQIVFRNKLPGYRQTLSFPQFRIMVAQAQAGARVVQSGMKEFFVRLKPCMVGIEACGTPR